ncbi:hypothetical protein [Actinomadura rupiterrae]|uniref:hypothetical protein n=1 Tax=Actinomadura rupiterrae TaxID=559627 RepID=UPI0020A248A5|nr:hypothetical protein [Actinomadura rupiterrae]MCP2334825.1 hypothetical protein [Actinomadura rupiterrae]
MRKLTRNTIIGGAVAAAAIGFTSIPASAVTGVDISAPGASSPSNAITGVNAGNVTAKDNSTGAAITCSKGTASGTSKIGTNLPLAGVATVSSLALSSPANPSGWCSGPVGITVQVTASNFPWTMNVTGVTASGVTPGQLTGIKASIVGSDNCHATVAGPGGAGGTISGNYNNSTHNLTTGGVGSTSNLTVQTVDANCDPTLINAGDSISLNGAFTITPSAPATGPLTINSHT